MNITKDSQIIKEKTLEKVNEEFNGYKGLEPTTYGDWQHKGKTTDF